MAAPPRSAGRGQNTLRQEEVARDFFFALSGFSLVGSSLAPSKIYPDTPWQREPKTSAKCENIRVDRLLR